MGYGTQQNVQLNVENWLYVKYNGVNFVAVDFEENVKSWDCLGDVHSKYGLKPSLLKYSVKIESLTQEDRDYLKEDGWMRGDQNTFEWEESPKGDFWGGYTRPAINEAGIKRTFPVELKAQIYISGFGRRDIFITISPSNTEDMVHMLSDMLENYIEEDEVKEYAEENDDSFEQAQQVLYDFQDDDFDANWKV